jgi:breast cancer 2 susceptibility protein
MILIVAAIHHPGPSTDPDEKDAPPPRPYLELSDGWYKILAEIDDCLARAISTGKIRVGRKLAISGAKLDSGSEGADVLEAFDKSRLIKFNFYGQVAFEAWGPAYSIRCWLAELDE